MYFEYRINKNSLIQTALLAIFPTGFIVDYPNKASLNIFEPVKVIGFKLGTHALCVIWIYSMYPI